MARCNDLCLKHCCKVLFYRSKDLCVLKRDYIWRHITSGDKVVSSWIGCKSIQTVWVSNGVQPFLAHPIYNQTEFSQIIVSNILFFKWPLIFFNHWLGHRWKEFIWFTYCSKMAWSWDRVFKNKARKQLRYSAATPRFSRQKSMQSRRWAGSEKGS